MKLKESIESLQKYVGRPWYTFLVALLALLDSFVVIFPIDFLLIIRVLFKSRNWWAVALIITTGSALGSFLLALATQVNFKYIAQWVGASNIHPGGHHAPGWHLVHQYGALGIGIIAFSFIPLQIPVIIAASKGISAVSIFAAAWVGRFVKYGIYSVIAAYAPQHVLTLGKFGKPFRDFLKHREEANGNCP